tara:strand:+ start:540 stop:1409 length:870 start_codon:yes stop_codon:yes gene_type:complete
MNVIGLGQAGCNIADMLSRHPQYKIYKIDVEIKKDFDFAEQYGEPEEKKKIYSVNPEKGPEEYEKNAPSMKTFFRGIKGETLFIVGGSGHISAMCLRIMEQIKDKCELSVLYIRPEPSLLLKTRRLHEKSTFKILQEFARSGLLDMLYIISNTNLENILGEVPIIGYNNKINELLVSTIHMINVFKNSEPVMGKIEEPSDVCRIATFGISDIEKGEEKLFFSLDNTTERCYIYGINEERLTTEGGLKKKIIDRIRSSSDEEGLQVSFGVFPTNYEQDYCYTLNYTSIIQ